ncbi:unnamed protein product [Trichogramma brassicae]|uniref:Reverse transcriptase domain-containing protein n=1 Tax=Trichogramma brassicae TaxID=86971 RepID=A0A6H5IFH6_9HYME|nr:unnamed protein product [Trichogramma brassicae]
MSGADEKLKPGWTTASSSKKRGRGSPDSNKIPIKRQSIIKDYWLNTVTISNKFGPLESEGTASDAEVQTVDDSTVENPSTSNTNKPPPIFAHGGSAILIRSGIKHYQDSKFCEDYLQATTVVTEDAHGRIAFSAVYSPPKHSISEEMYCAYFDRLGDRFVTGGDFNAKHPWWGSRLQVPNPKGRTLYSVITGRKYFTVSTGEPTYWPTDRNKTPDLIDFAVISGLNSNDFYASSCFDLSSDHSPVLIHISSQLLNNQVKSPIFNKLTDWATYREHLNSLINCNIPLKTNTDIDAAALNLNSHILTAIKKSTPHISTHTNSYSVPRYITKMILEKRKLRRIWQLTRTQSAKSALNHATRELTKSLDEYKNNCIQSYLKELSPGKSTDYSLWKATKKLKRPKQHSSPIVNQDGVWARSDDEKALEFAQYYAGVFKPLEAVISDEDERRLLEPKNRSDQDNFGRVGCEEVVSIIGSLKEKKAPGWDGIGGKLVKELPPKAIRYLSVLINACYRLCYFPNAWKRAQLIVIPKPGKDPTQVNSYRPISLLPVFSKIAERTIQTRLNQAIAANSLIPEHQFGFRSKHATAEQVNRLTTEIRASFENKTYCNAVFLDVSQAFDRVWHKGLIFKLKALLPIKLSSLLESYLCGRTFQVKVGDSITDLYPCEAGVPQGSVLGPTLYLLFTADFPVARNVFIATYADDTAVLTSSRCHNEASRSLQNHLDKVSEWCDNWRIKINETKSNHITFTLRKYTCPPVYLKGASIPSSGSGQVPGDSSGSKTHLAAPYLGQTVEYVEQAAFASKHGKRAQVHLPDKTTKGRAESTGTEHVGRTELRVKCDGNGCQKSNRRAPRRKNKMSSQSSNMHTVTAEIHAPPNSDPDQIMTVPDHASDHSEGEMIG